MGAHTGDGGGRIYCTGGEERVSFHYACTGGDAVAACVGESHATTSHPIPSPRLVFTTTVSTSRQGVCGRSPAQETCHAHVGFVPTKLEGKDGTRRHQTSHAPPVVESAARTLVCPVGSQTGAVH